MRANLRVSALSSSAARGSRIAAHADSRLQVSVRDKRLGSARTHVKRVRGGPVRRAIGNYHSCMKRPLPSGRIAAFFSLVLAGPVACGAPRGARPLPPARDRLRVLSSPGTVPRLDPVRASPSCPRRRSCRGRGMAFLCAVERWWLLVLSDAPYIVTDFVHASGQRGARAGSRRGHDASSRRVGGRVLGWSESSSSMGWVERRLVRRVGWLMAGARLLASAARGSYSAASTASTLGAITPDATLLRGFADVSSHDPLASPQRIGALGGAMGPADGRLPRALYTISRSKVPSSPVSAPTPAETTQQQQAPRRPAAVPSPMARELAEPNRRPACACLVVASDTRSGSRLGLVLAPSAALVRDSPAPLVGDVDLRRRIGRRTARIPLGRTGMLVALAPASWVGGERGEDVKSERRRDGGSATVTAFARAFAQLSSF